MRKDNNMGKLSTNIPDEHQFLVNLKTAQKLKIKTIENTSQSSGDATAIASSSSSSTSTTSITTKLKTIPSTVKLPPFLSVFLTSNILTINLSDKKLTYRAEGNANLVLSLPHTKQVLRLRKTDINERFSAGKYIILFYYY